MHKLDLPPLTEITITQSDGSGKVQTTRFKTLNSSFEIVQTNARPREIFELGGHRSVRPQEPPCYSFSIQGTIPPGEPPTFEEYAPVTAKQISDVLGRMPKEALK